jgi:hypothetical protein
MKLTQGILLTAVVGLVAAGLAACSSTGSSDSVLRIGASASIDS